MAIWNSCDYSDAATVQPLQGVDALTEPSQEVKRYSHSACEHVNLHMSPHDSQQIGLSHEYDIAIV